MTDDRTVDDLIASAENAPQGRVCDALAAIRQEASADGITVTVDLYGKLVGLDLRRSALERGAADVARRIGDLVAEASATACHRGLAVLADLPGLTESPLLDEIRDRLPAKPAPAEPTRSARVPARPATQPDSDDDAVPVIQAAW